MDVEVCVDIIINFIVDFIARLVQFQKKRKIGSFGEKWYIKLLS